MKNESLHKEKGRKRSAIRSSQKELLRDLPPVAMLPLHQVISYDIKNEDDLVCFIKRAQPNGGWIAEAADPIVAFNPLSPKGLIFSAKSFCDSLKHVHFESSKKEPVIEEPLKIILYRIVCELVNNARKHARATHVFVQLIAEKKLLSVTVCDNGQGFDPETVTIGAGLENIATAVITYGGIMAIHASPRGTEISIEIEQRV